MTALYIKEPYLKKLKTEIIQPDTTKDQTSFKLKDAILVPPIPHVTKGDHFFINGQEGQIDPSGQVSCPLEGVQEGMAVEVEIDWTHRLGMMQTDLGRIILKLALKNLLGLDPIFEETEGAPYLLLDLKDLSLRQLNQLEDLANRIIQSNLPVSYKAPLMVQVEGFPSMASQLPLLKRTGECGLIALGPLERREEGLALSFKAGLAALEDYRDHRRFAMDLSLLFQNQDLPGLWSHIKRLQGDINRLKKENKDLEGRLGLDQVNDYTSLARPLGPYHLIYSILRSVNFKELKHISQAVLEKRGYIQILGLPNGAKSQLLVLRSRDIPVDLKAIFSDLKDPLALEGSGNLYRIQANVDSDKLKMVMEAFLARIKKDLDL
ncbi:MAG: hypothetical protein Q4E37_07005 [Tissierellia bacterium]|nr:hypothetical protein [Tissierellia bacterium]